jgi:hypothetical protein
MVVCDLVTVVCGSVKDVTVALVISGWFSRQLVPMNMDSGSGPE